MGTDHVPAPPKQGTKQNGRNNAALAVARTNRLRASSPNPEKDGQVTARRLESNHRGERRKSITSSTLHSNWNRAASPKTLLFQGLENETVESWEPFPPIQSRLPLWDPKEIEAIMQTNPQKSVLYSDSELSAKQTGYLAQVLSDWDRENSGNAPRGSEYELYGRKWANRRNISSQTEVSEFTDLNSVMKENRQARDDLVALQKQLTKLNSSVDLNFDQKVENEMSRVTHTLYSRLTYFMSQMEEKNARVRLSHAKQVEALISVILKHYPQLLDHQDIKILVAQTKSQVHASTLSVATDGDAQFNFREIQAPGAATSDPGSDRSHLKHGRDKEGKSKFRLHETVNIHSFFASKPTMQDIGDIVHGYNTILAENEIRSGKIAELQDSIGNSTALLTARNSEIDNLQKEISALRHRLQRAESSIRAGGSSGDGTLRPLSAEPTLDVSDNAVKIRLLERQLAQSNEQRKNERTLFEREQQELEKTLLERSNARFEAAQAEWSSTEKELRDTILEQQNRIDKLMKDSAMLGLAETRQQGTVNLEKQKTARRTLLRSETARTGSFSDSSASTRGSIDAGEGGKSKEKPQARSRLQREDTSQQHQWKTNVTFES